LQEGFESCDELETNDCLEVNDTYEEETPCVLGCHLDLKKKLSSITGIMLN
jgi:hypothetical protein